MSETTRKQSSTVPATAAEDFSITEEERRALVNSLIDAEKDMEAGNAIEYAPKAFRERLLGIYRSRKR